MTHVWLVTEQHHCHTNVVRVTAGRDGGKRVAELDYHERVDGELQWHDYNTISEARVGDSIYWVRQIEVME